ncbi:MAG TPA: hypothetical protein VK638_27530 [Edaphobacter sp.]|nr:hypothetical protein [Edaphobacter sp.]
MVALICDADCVVEDERIADLSDIPKTHINGVYFMHLWLCAMEMSSRFDNQGAQQ